MYCSNRLLSYLELSDGYTEIGLVETVGYIPTLSAELPPFLYQSVEEAQTEQQLLELKFLAGTAAEKFGIVDGVVEIRLEKVLT